MSLLGKYIQWLHLRWPAGVVEKLPLVDEHGRTNISGLYIVGDLTGIPLLKFSSDSGARAVEQMLAEPGFPAGGQTDGVLDLAIIGAGVSGMAAALAARNAGLRFEIFEATEPFSTVLNFPKGKLIYTYPTDMVPAGDLQFTATVKESLVAELVDQTLAEGIEPRPLRVERVEKVGEHFQLVVPDADEVMARRVVVGIGRSGNFRKLGVPGEELDKVSNRLHDPMDFAGKNVLVVGGGDSALETAIAVASMATELIRGKTADEALALRHDELTGDLGALPPMKIHCAQLVEGALNSALSGETAPTVNAETGPTLIDSLQSPRTKGGKKLRLLEEDGKDAG